MANDDRNDAFQFPAQALSAVLGAAESGRKAVTNTADALAAFQRSAVMMEQLVVRMNDFLDEIVAPVRGIVPQVQRLVGRFETAVDLLEPAIEALVPGLQNVAVTLESAAVRALPDTLDGFRSVMAALGDLVNEVPKRVGPMVELFGGAERLASLGRMFGSMAPPSPVAASDGAASDGPASDGATSPAAATTGAAQASPAAKTPRAAEASPRTTAAPKKASPKKASPKKASPQAKTEARMA